MYLLIQYFIKIFSNISTILESSMLCVITVKNVRLEVDQGYNLLRASANKLQGFTFRRKLLVCKMLYLLN